VTNLSVLDRLLRRDRMMEAWSGRRMMANKKARALDRRMIDDLVSEMKKEVPGRSVDIGITNEVIEMACWTKEERLASSPPGS
jgi:hypothetical protein